MVGLCGGACHFAANDADVLTYDAVVVISVGVIVRCDAPDAPKVEWLEVECVDIVNALIVVESNIGVISGAGGVSGVVSEVHGGKALDDGIVDVPVESNGLPRDKRVDTVGNGAKKVIVVLGNRCLKKVYGGRRGGHGGPHPPKAVPHPRAQPAVGSGSGGTVEVPYDPRCCSCGGGGEGWGPDGEVFPIVNGG